MSALERLVEEALREPLAAAQAHVRAGGRAVGYVGGEVPVELIIAGGAFALRLPCEVPAETALADRYLEPSFAPEVRSIAQQYLEGAFDFLQAIVLPRANDSAQRLYYYLCELRGDRNAGPDLLIFDLAKIPRETSRAYSGAAAERLGAQLGADAAGLPRAIEARNRRRDLYARVAERRRTAAVRGSRIERLTRAADRCAAAAFDDALDAWLDGVAPGPAGPYQEAPRLVLAGSAPPDERLHLAVEAAGGNVVAEWGEHAACAVAQPPVAVAGAFDAIGDHYHALRTGTRAFVDSARGLTALAGAVQAHGVIIWLVEQEDAHIWELPAQTAALSAAGVPVLALSRRGWDGADARAEIAAFTRGLGGEA
jgi:hypothetical protein